MRCSCREKLGMMEQGETLENRHRYPVSDAVKAVESHSTQG
jgi:hypothetical protein